MPNYSNLPERHFVDKAKKLSFGDQDKDTYFDGDTLNAMLEEITALKENQVTTNTYGVMPSRADHPNPCGVYFVKSGINYKTVMNDIKAGKIVQIKYTDLGSNLQLVCAYAGKCGMPAEDGYEQCDFYVFSCPYIVMNQSEILEKTFYIVLDYTGGTKNNALFGINAALVAILK